MAKRVTKAQKEAFIQIAEQNANTTKKDVGTWTRARQSALSVTMPNRSLLYDVYDDAMLDLHLSGCIGQRKGMTEKKSFALADFKSGKANEDAMLIFESQWFKDFVSATLDSRFYGYSLVEFGSVLDNGTAPLFEFCEVLNRRHVIPEHGVIVRSPYDDWHSGVSYREGELAEWCIGIGRRKDLGLLLKCAPQTLSKKNMMAYWDKFGELFGMPVRIGKTVSTDETEISNLTDMLQRMGAAAWGLFPEGTDIEIKETGRGDAFQVYDRRIERANLEISKCILNQTMTIDSGGSYSQSEVHLEVFRNVCDGDADFVRDTVNGQLLPFLVKKGFPVSGLRFNWRESVDYTPEQQVAIDRMVLDNYEVEPSYIIEKYGIPVTGKKVIPSFIGGGVDAKHSRNDIIAQTGFDPFG
jgi:hypothetical protein